MVKSRRSASARQSRPKTTRALRPNVSTSWRRRHFDRAIADDRAVTVPCSIPVGTALPPAASTRRVTSSGNAVVATSISPIGTRNKALRTAPPTTRASSPSRSSRERRRATSPSFSQAASASCGTPLTWWSSPARTCRPRYAPARKSSLGGLLKTARAQEKLPAIRMRDAMIKPAMRCKVHAFGKKTPARVANRKAA